MSIEKLGSSLVFMKLLVCSSAIHCAFLDDGQPISSRDPKLRKSCVKSIPRLRCNRQFYLFSIS